MLEEKRGAHFQEFNNVQNQILPHREFWQSLQQEITFFFFFFLIIFKLLKSTERTQYL